MIATEALEAVDLAPVAGRFGGDARALNQPIQNWDVSKVTNMKGMFSSARVINQDLTRWDM